MPANLSQTLRFYFITDDGVPQPTPVDQVALALNAGATIVQYRNKRFALGQFDEVVQIQRLCRHHNVPLIINDNVLLAKAVEADGVHLGQGDAPPKVARQILGEGPIIGLSVHNLTELAQSDLGCCNYIGTGPTYATNTKADTEPVCGLEGLSSVAQASSLPVVAIGGITVDNAGACFEHGATGIAVISTITRAQDPLARAMRLAHICGVDPRIPKSG